MFEKFNKNKLERNYRKRHINKLAMFVLQTLSKGNMQITSKKMLTEPDVKLKGKKVLSNDQNLNNLPA